MKAGHKLGFQHLYDHSHEENQLTGTVRWYVCVPVNTCLRTCHFFPL